jgi:hypothetical protein
MEGKIEGPATQLTRQLGDPELFLGAKRLRTEREEERRLDWSSRERALYPREHQHGKQDSLDAFRGRGREIGTNGLMGKCSQASGGIHYSPRTILVIGMKGAGREHDKSRSVVRKTSSNYQGAMKNCRKSTSC